MRDTENKKQQSNLLALLPVLFGAFIWLLVLVGRIPYSVFELTHVQILLVAAPLWLIPLCWQIDRQSNWTIWLAMLFGILFSMAYQLTPGPIAAGFVLPWFLFAVSLAFKKVKSFDRTKTQHWVELAGYLFLPVGIFWAIIDRLGIQILGYDPTIILLTAVHFHYAGFILPQVTSWLIGKNTTFLKRLIGVGIIAGIPLVAIGISGTHFQWPGWIEVICVTVMALAGTGVGVLHMRLAIQVKSNIQKLFFFIGGLSLLLGMSLALCYGWRHIFVIETLTVPWMYAVHGTCNAVGFAAPVLLAWRFKKLIN